MLFFFYLYLNILWKKKIIFENKIHKKNPYYCKYITLCISVKLAKGKIWKQTEEIELGTIRVDTIYRVNENTFEQ